MKYTPLMSDSLQLPPAAHVITTTRLYKRTSPISYVNVSSHSRSLMKAGSALPYVRPLVKVYVIDVGLRKHVSESAAENQEISFGEMSVDADTLARV